MNDQLMDKILIGGNRNVQYLDSANKSDSSSSDSIDLADLKESKKLTDEKSTSFLKGSMASSINRRQQFPSANDVKGSEVLSRQTSNKQKEQKIHTDLAKDNASKLSIKSYSINTNMQSD